jgi:hypothetical protein
VGLVVVDMKEKMIYFYEKKYVKVDGAIYDVKEFEKLEFHIIPKLKVTYLCTPFLFHNTMFYVYFYICSK